ncbi:MAG: T9SS C-terminal target domain-containing protein [Haliscomenobacteraceae bacterium CHB4]|nr:hypothetical protein [Saprospiraceae bacterium]MCE7925742.1 T9SS C-terminal target domain-containing protein [Haliscomenobacteraceae bacterium CHB4]
MRINLFSKTAIALYLMLAIAANMWSQTATISGRVTNVAGSGLEDVNVQLTSQSGGNWFDMSDDQGNYSFTVPLGDTYTIAPQKDDNPLFGVTTFDAVLIAKHILGELPFTTPYQIIAADANCDNSVELLDTIELRKLILGIYSELPCGSSYRFVRADYIFPDPQNPFPFPETITIENLSGDVGGQDFIGVKIGDVNGSSAFATTGVSCRVRIDTDLNCALGVDEPPLEDWLVTCYGSIGDVFTGTTSSTGNCFIPMHAGTFDVVLTPPNALWDICADTVYGVQVEFLDSSAVDFSVQTIVACPLLEVDLSALFLRRCFESTYEIFYCNKGTALAEDAFVDVEFDPYLTVVSSEISWSSVNGNTYTFPVGNVGVGECESFDVVVNASCDAVLGQTHCSEARIYPDTLCFENPQWNGANLEVEGECQNGEVIFTITNTGEDMTEPVNYIVIEDIMVQMSGGSIQLGSSESEIITIPANGSTWRINLDQAPNNPWNTLVTAAVEGCGENGSGTFSLGFVTQFPENEWGGHVDEDCQENVGSYDPNDKQGFPRGVSDEHFIPKGTEIEYMIRFQNTGTDTAFTVRILDTLSQYLDLTTLRPGSSSHAYDFKMLGSGVAQFLFANILLPDSNVNEPASNGYVKFRIEPKAELPNNTAIENQAAIFFDFNAPVMTNRTLHTVGEQFLDVSTVVFRPGVQLEVYPNPAFAKATFFIHSATPAEGTLRLFDLQGRLVRTQPFAANTFELDAAGLTSGMYLFRLESGGNELAAGKLAVQRRE